MKDFMPIRNTFLPVLQARVLTKQDDRIQVVMAGSASSMLCGGDGYHYDCVRTLDARHGYKHSPKHTDIEIDAPARAPSAF